MERSDLLLLGRGSDALQLSKRLSAGSHDPVSYTHLTLPTS